MSVSDPIADMLTKVRNASLAKFEKVDIPASKLKVEIAKILKNEGYIKTFKKITPGRAEPDQDLSEIRRRQPRRSSTGSAAYVQARPPGVHRLQ